MKSLLEGEKVVRFPKFEGRFEGKPYKRGDFLQSSQYPEKSFQASLKQDCVALISQWVLLNFLGQSFSEHYLVTSFRFRETTENSFNKISKKKTKMKVKIDVCSCRYCR